MLVDASVMIKVHNRVTELEAAEKAEIADPSLAKSAEEKAVERLQ